MLKSIFIYLIVFFTSISMFKLGDITSGTLDKYRFLYAKKCKKISGIFYLLGCIIPCLLASLRSDSVGIDVGLYITPEISKIFSDTDLLNFLETTIIDEQLFAVLLFFSYKIANIQFVFFIIQFLAIYPVFLAIKNSKPQNGITLSMTLYLFLFYNINLCVMRQSIAMAFVILSYSYLCLQSKKKSLFFMIIAILFHKSSIIISAIIWILYYIRENKYYKLYICFWGFLILFFVFYQDVFNILLLVMNKISARYSYYVIEYLGSEKEWGNIPTTDFLAKSLMVILPSYIIFNKKMCRNGEIIKEFFMLTLLGRYFVLFNANFYESMRIAFYFDYFLLMLSSKVLTLIKNREKRLICSIFLVGLSASYWIYFMIIKKAYGTVPFNFFWE